MFMWPVQRVCGFFKWDSLPKIDQLGDDVCYSWLLAHVGKSERLLTQARGPVLPLQTLPSCFSPLASVALSLPPIHVPSFNPHSQEEAADPGQPLKGPHVPSALTLPT